MALNPFQGLKLVASAKEADLPEGLNGPKSLSGIETIPIVGEALASAFGLNGPKSLSGIETQTYSPKLLQLPTRVSMALNPFQGLKLSQKLAGLKDSAVSMALNPFQGLKRKVLLSGEIASRSQWP